MKMCKGCHWMPAESWNGYCDKCYCQGGDTEGLHGYNPPTAKQATLLKRVSGNGKYGVDPLAWEDAATCSAEIDRLIAASKARRAARAAV